MTVVDAKRTGRGNQSYTLVLAERRMPSSFESVDQLLPPPAPYPSVLSPKTLPGASYEFKLAV